MMWALIRESDNRIVDVQDEPGDSWPSAGTYMVEVSFGREEIGKTYDPDTGGIVVPPPSERDEFWARLEEFRLDPATIELMQRMRTASPAEIDAWLDGNVNNTPQVRAVLKAMVKVMVVMLRI